MTVNESFIGRKSIVLDNGTGISKNGYSGEDQPRSVFPTVIGKPKYGHIMPEVKDYSREWYIGEEAMELLMTGLQWKEYGIIHFILI